MRTMIERLSRYVVLRRNLPLQFGRRPIYVSPGAALRFWGKIESVDPTLLGNVDRLVRPNDVVWDVGANVGLFAFSAAAKAGPGGTVLAVEADTWLVNLLRKSAVIQNTNSARVSVLPAAISDTLGVANFHIAVRGRASNHLQGHENSQAGGTRQVQSVLTVTLDWLLQHFPPPDIVKIDVEGAEALVLAGAHQLLSRVRPTILCEVNRDSQETVTTLLKKHRYLIEDADADPVSRRPIDYAAWNTLATPLPPDSTDNALHPSVSVGDHPQP